MTALNNLARRTTALVSLILLPFPFSALSAQSTSRAVPAATQYVAAADGLPNSPGAVRSSAAGAANQTYPDQTTPAQQSSSSQAPESNSQTPLGTAAAPYLKPDGISASRPAGAAIAPAKQRRIRTVSIRTGLIIGAVVAIGAVAGASLASPSRAN